MNRFSYQSRAGFTLIELIIYVGLTAVLVGVLSTILITITRVQGQQNASSIVTQELNFLMTSFRRDIHSAKSIEAPGLAGSPVSSVRLVLDPTTVPATVRVISFDADQHIVTVSDEGVNPTVTSQLSSSKTYINSLSFTRIGDYSLQIELTATASTTGTDIATRSVKTTASLLVQDQ